jgi:hypothetical protein
MFNIIKRRLLVVTVALGVATAGLAAGAEAALSKDAYRAGKDRIEAQAKTQRKACDRFKGNTKDVCLTRAKGWQKVAKAELEAQYKPSPEAEKMAKFARADADYDVARQRCEALKGRTHDTCLGQARHDHEAAIRLAKVEKVEEQHDLKAKAGGQRQAPPKPAPKS